MYLECSNLRKRQRTADEDAVEYDRGLWLAFASSLEDCLVQPFMRTLPDMLSIILGKQKRKRAKELMEPLLGWLQNGKYIKETGVKRRRKREKEEDESPTAPGESPEGSDQELTGPPSDQWETLPISGSNSDQLRGSEYSESGFGHRFQTLWGLQVDYTRSLSEEHEENYHEGGITPVNALERPAEIVDHSAELWEENIFEPQNYTPYNLLIEEAEEVLVRDFVSPAPSGNPFQSPRVSSASVKQEPGEQELPPSPCVSVTQLLDCTDGSEDVEELGELNPTLQMSRNFRRPDSIPQLEDFAYEDRLGRDRLNEYLWFAPTPHPQATALSRYNLWVCPLNLPEAIRQLWQRLRNRTSNPSTGLASSSIVYCMDMKSSRPAVIPYLTKPLLHKYGALIANISGYWYDPLCSAQIYGGEVISHYMPKGVGANLLKFWFLRRSFWSILNNVSGIFLLYLDKRCTRDRVGWNVDCCVRCGAFYKPPTISPDSRCVCGASLKDRNMHKPPPPSDLRKQYYPGSNPNQVALADNDLIVPPPGAERLLDTILGDTRILLGLLTLLHWLPPGATFVNSTAGHKVCRTCGLAGIRNNGQPCHFCTYSSGRRSGEWTFDPGIEEYVLGDDDHDNAGLASLGRAYRVIKGSRSQATDTSGE